MSVIWHFVETVGIVFLLFSYLSCGYIAFFHPDENVQKVAFSLRVFLWLLSPFVVLDIIAEKVFGRSLLS